MTSDTSNKRAKQRSRCLKEGKIVFANGSFVIDCVIDNQSATGAHLRVEGTAPLPREFFLVEPGREIVHRAEIVRRTHKGLGVKLNGVIQGRVCEAYLKRFKR